MFLFPWETVYTKTLFNVWSLDQQYQQGLGTPGLLGENLHFKKRFVLGLSADPLAINQVNETTFKCLLLIGSFTPLEFKLQEGQKIHVSCSLLYFQCLELCLAEGKCSINAEGMNKWMDERMNFYQLGGIGNVA